ncbi:FUSC family protein, partial [Aciditerrimonas ferrireducens]
SLRGALGALADPAGARHAVRLAVVLVAGSLLAHGLGLANGYWVPMTAAVVVRGDFTGTLRRGLGRALGTLAGAGLVTLATTLTHPGTPLLVAGTVVAGLGTYILFRANYGLYSVFLTSTVVLLLALVGASPGRTAEERVLATVAGAALALAVFLLWPTWREDLLPGTLAAAARAQRDYATTLLALADTPQVSAVALARLDSLGRRARTTRARLLALTGALPAATPDSPSRCLGAIAELAHTSLALHAQLLARARLAPSDGGPDPAGPHPARLDPARLDPAEATRRVLAELDQAGCPDQPTLA